MADPLHCGHHCDACNAEETLFHDFQESFHEMFPRYYIDSDIVNRLISSITHWCVIPVSNGQYNQEEIVFYLDIGT